MEQTPLSTEENEVRQHFSYIFYARSIADHIVSSIPEMRDAQRELYRAFAQMLSLYPLLELPEVNKETGDRYTPADAQTITDHYLELAYFQTSTLTPEELLTVKEANRSIRDLTRQILHHASKSSPVSNLFPDTSEHENESDTLYLAEHLKPEDVKWYMTVPMGNIIASDAILKALEAGK